MPPNRAIAKARIPHAGSLSGDEPAAARWRRSRRQSEFSSRFLLYHSGATRSEAQVEFTCKHATRHAVGGGGEQALFSEWGRQFRVVGVRNEHRKQLGRLGLAGVGADVVAVSRHFGEVFSSLVNRDRPFVDLTADRAFEHGRVDEGGFGMGVTRRGAARAVFDE